MSGLAEDSDGVKVITSLTKLGSLTVVTDAEVSRLCEVALPGLLVVGALGNPGTLGDTVRVDSAEEMEAPKPVVPAKAGAGVTVRMAVLVSVLERTGREAVASEAPDEKVVPRSLLLPSVTKEFKGKFVVSGLPWETV